jgi:hypothetical protein
MNRTSVANLRLVILNGAAFFSGVKDPLFDQYASAPVVPTNYNHQRQTSRQHNPPQQTRGDGP